MTYSLTKKVCQLDDQGIYVGQTDADLSPEEATNGVYLMPAGCVDIDPPKEKKGFVAKWTNGGWEYTENHVGETVYSVATKESLIISDFGAIPEGYTTIPPESDLYEWDGKAWVIPPEKLTALLQEQRATVRAQINAKRDACVDGGAYVAAIGKWVDSDEKGRATLVEIKADFDLNGKDNTYTLICADNTAKTLNFEEFKAVWDVVKTLKEKMFENAYMHKILLEQAENPLEYDWSIGWSETYDESKQKNS